MRTAEAAGFDSVSVADHLTQVPAIGPVESEVLEAYTTLGFVAAHTSRVELLTVVSAVTLRHPRYLVESVRTLDRLSGGRAWLGVGAAWNEAEHRAFGIPFPPIGARLALVEEAVRLCRASGGPPVMIGGSGERGTLRLVARHADACSVHPPFELERKLDVLRRLCEAEGRDYDAIRRTCMVLLDVRDRDRVRALVARLRTLAAAGIDAVIGDVPDIDRIRPLEIIGREVIPAIAGLGRA